VNIARSAAALAAGMAAAVSVAHAQSNVQLFGVVDAYVARKQLASVSGARTINVDSGGMTTSQFGMRGSEDLGAGLASVFELSGFVRADSGEPGRFAGDPFFSRTAFVGLRGPWGLVRLGRITTPNFVATIRLNPFGDSSVLSPMLLHSYIGGQPMDASIASGGPAGISDSGHSNVVAYTTPEFGGFSGAANYSLGEVAGSSSANGRLGYSLTYASGPVVLALSGERVKRPVVPAPPVVSAANQKQDQQTDQLGGSYDLGVVKVFGQVSRTSITLPAAASRNFRTTQLGVAFPFGMGRFLVSGASTRKSETAIADVRRRTVSVGYDHDLSKRTDLYAVAMRDAVTAMRHGTTLAVGIRHRF